MCGPCYELGPTKRYLSKNQMGEAIRQVRAVKADQCGFCQQSLGVKGPRFWFCEGCEVECGSAVHQGWV